MSSCRRQTASWRSSSVSQRVVRGKLGRMKNAAAATTMVIAPSIMNSCTVLVACTDRRTCSTDPAPSFEASCAIHVPRNTSRDETGKGTRKQRPCVENGGAKGQFLARVPHGEEEETAWEISSFHKPQAKANGNQSAKTLSCSSRSGDGTPNHHAAGQVNAGLSKLGQEQVGGNLHEDVSSEEHRHCRVVLDIGHVKVLLQTDLARQPSSGDVVTVCEKGLGTSHFQHKSNGTTDQGSS